MIATSTILNPIKFFNTEEEIYWQQPDNVKNGPDRGNFVRMFPAIFGFNLYFEADAPILFLDLRKCSDDSVVGSYAVNSLGGGLYQANVFGTPNYPDDKVYLQVRNSNPAVKSEQLYFVTGYYFDQLTRIDYKNLKAFAGLPSNTLLTTYLNITFWQQKNPQTYSDIEITPGEFTRLTNHIHRVIKLETDYYPAYLHEMIQVILGLDYVFINNKEWIMRNDYSFDYGNRHYALAKGMIELTERKSILRNTI